MKKIIVLILLFFAFQVSSFAQEKRSAKKYFESEEASATSINIAIDSAKHYLDIDHYKSLDFIEQGLKTSFENKDQYRKEAGVLYEILGDIYFRLEQYDLAKKNYLFAIQNYEIRNSALQLKLVETYLNLGDISNANVLLNKLDQTNQDVKILLEVYKFRGDLKEMIDDSDAALILYNQGLDLSNRMGLTTQAILFDNRIADIYANRGEIDSAAFHLERCISNTSELEPGVQLQQAETNAAFYRKNNDLAKEVDIRQQSIGVLNTLNEEEDVSGEIQYQNLQIADAYIEKEDYGKAIPYLEKSKDADQEKGDLEIEIEATRKLSAAYEKAGNYNKALENYRKYVELTDELYSDKEAEITEAVNLARDLSVKQQRIDGLELDRELSESKEKIYEKDKSIATLNDKRQKLIIYSLLGGLLLALLAIFFFYKNLQQRKIANNLLALKALKSQMNPHFIFNALNSVNNFIAVNDERKANKYITDFSRLMRMVLDVSDKDFISLQEEFELIQLYTHLEHNRFDDRFDYEINVDDTLRSEELKIPPMLIQPFIENAVWHGLRYKDEKGFLSINAINIGEKGFRISISDNGIGRKRSKELKSNNQLKRESKGMHNVQERIKIIKEMFDIQIELKVSDLNANGSGTKVELDFPSSTI